MPVCVCIDMLACTTVLSSRLVSQPSRVIVNAAAAAVQTDVTPSRRNATFNVSFQRTDRCMQTLL